MDESEHAACHVVSSQPPAFLSSLHLWYQLSLSTGLMTYRTKKTCVDVSLLSSEQQQVQSSASLYSILCCKLLCTFLQPQLMSAILELRHLRLHASSCCGFSELNLRYAGVEHATCLCYERQFGNRIGYVCI